MRKTKEVLGLLLELGLGQWQITRSCGMGLGTVHTLTAFAARTTSSKESHDHAEPPDDGKAAGHAGCTAWSRHSRAQEQDRAVNDLSFLERLAPLVDQQMLVDQQWTWRENQELARRLKAAKLRGPDKTAVRVLASTLAQKACRNGYSALYLRAAALSREPASEAQQRSFGGDLGCRGKGRPAPIATSDVLLWRKLRQTLRCTFTDGRRSLGMVTRCRLCVRQNSAMSFWHLYRIACA
jgi:hypothetical protein